MTKRKGATTLQSKLFKQSSLERISSPEKLNDYIQVSNPGSWMVLAAALALLLGVLAWGIFGQMEESMSFSGQVKNGQLQCYVSWEQGEALKAGMEAMIAPYASASSDAVIHGSILHVAEQPVSFEEASKEVASDYMMSVLGLSGWNIAVTVAPQEPLYEGVAYRVEVVTDTYRPIELVFQ